MSITEDLNRHRLLPEGRRVSVRVPVTGQPLLPFLSLSSEATPFLEDCAIRSTPGVTSVMLKPLCPQSLRGPS